MIYGRDGGDVLEGGRGNDLLKGGAGEGRLTGGFDRDRLYGGSGADHLNSPVAIRAARLTTSADGPAVEQLAADDGVLRVPMRTKLGTSTGR